MAKPGSRFGLSPEAADVLGRCQVAGKDHLDGHRPVEALLASPVDHAHPPPANLLQKFVRAEITGHLDSRRGQGDRRVELGSLFLDRPGDAVQQVRGNAVQPVQAIHRTGQLGVLSQQLVAIRTLAGL